MRHPKALLAELPKRETKSFILLRNLISRFNLSCYPFLSISNPSSSLCNFHSSPSIFCSLSPFIGKEQNTLQRRDFFIDFPITNYFRFSVSLSKSILFTNYSRWSSLPPLLVSGEWSLFLCKFLDAFKLQSNIYRSIWNFGDEFSGVKSESNERNLWEFISIGVETFTSLFGAGVWGLRHDDFDAIICDTITIFYLFMNSVELEQKPNSSLVLYII